MDRREWLQQAGGLTAAGLVFGASPGSADATTTTAPDAPDASFHPRQVQGRVPDEKASVFLDSNENPLGPSPMAKKVVMDAFEKSFRYPGAAYGRLLEQLAEKHDVSTDHIVLGTGSSEVLTMAGAAYGLDGGEVVTGHPSYKALGGYAETMGGYVSRVPLTDEMKLDLEAMDRRTTASSSLVFVCNPNNPTGTVVDPSTLTAFTEEVSRRAVVFVDEAYIDFVEDDKRSSGAVDLVRQGENVIVSRTFSKLYGMAGLRIGYGIARPDIIERIEAYSMGMPNTVGLHAASESLKDTTFQEESRKKIMAARDYTTSVLDDMGLEYADSQASFVFFKSGMEIKKLQKKMRAQGVEVGRPFPPYTDWCRVSMGTMDDMKAFESALRTVMT
jgi:histidinol-phosphate aminotransferase